MFVVDEQRAGAGAGRVPDWRIRFSFSPLLVWARDFLEMCREGTK